jgi:transcriptional regulator GlxA family with amidase domain
MNKYPGQYSFKNLAEAKLFIEINYYRMYDFTDIGIQTESTKVFFSKAFENMYGYTPEKYLIFIKMDRAKQLLLKNIPVAAVSSYVGFKTIDLFTFYFREMVGLSPEEYQEQYKGAGQKNIKSILKLIPHCFAFQLGWVKE